MACELHNVTSISFHCENVYNIIGAVIEAITINGDPQSVRRPVAEQACATWRVECQLLFVASVGPDAENLVAVCFRNEAREADPAIRGVERGVNSWRYTCQKRHGNHEQSEFAHRLLLWLQKSSSTKKRHQSCHLSGLKTY